ncbi:MAG TPA: hypothetical protein PKE03_07395 [Bacteroidales bacterium]|nr:hypothetical protein [Bacteroidales bacterium]
MKKLIIILLMLPLIGYSQNDLGEAGDIDRIALDVIIPEQVSKIPEFARSLLESKLIEAVTEYGMGGKGVSPRFCVTAKMEVLSKDIAPTTPTMQTYTFQVFLYLVDYVDKNILSTTSFTTKGAGNNENRAYINALRPINLKNQNVEMFLEKGKRKIIEYYNTRCDFVIARAKSQASQNQFSEALATLSGVPEVSKDCYMRALKEIGPIYQDFIDHDCKMMISSASYLWAAEPNSDGALKAGAILCRIDPDSRCYDDAQSIIRQMAAKVQKDEKRDWDFFVKQFENDVKLEALRIRAFRDIGVAWGENQQPVITYQNLLWVFR